MATNEPGKTETYKVDQSLRKSDLHKHRSDLLTALNLTSLFSETSVMVIDGSEKCNCWLNHEHQSLRVIERSSNVEQSLQLKH